MACKRLFAHRHHTLLVSLAHHPQHAKLRIQVRRFQPAEFAHPQSGSIKQLTHRLVACPLRPLAAPGGQVLHLLTVQELRQAFPLPGQRNERRRVVGDLALGEQKAIEVTQAHKVSPDGPAGKAGIVKRVKVTAYRLIPGHVGPGSEGKPAMLPAPFVELSKITGIRINCQRSQPLLDSAEIEIRPDQNRQLRGGLGSRTRHFFHWMPVRATLMGLSRAKPLTTKRPLPNGKPRYWSQ